MCPRLDDKHAHEAENLSKTVGEKNKTERKRITDRTCSLHKRYDIGRRR